VINEIPTRLDAEDLGLWKAAGLLLNDDGLVEPASPVPMKEDMLSNALVWLLAKISNFIAAGEDITLRPDLETEQLPFGVSQQTLLKRWERLRLELQHWHNGLPETFSPCARVSPSRRELRDHFSEVWYSMPMCASAMQNYHMARILLLVNKPHESTARHTTVTERLKSYDTIAKTTRIHAREICGIALSRLQDSAHVHSLQPLFVAGQCLTEPQERALVLELLRGIQTDLGWSTDFRVQQLLEEWNWEDT
jgi:hypothetical protein